MDRRTFIFKTGTVVSAGFLLGQVPGGLSVLAGTQSNPDFPEERQDPGRFPQPVLKAIAWGLNAPNPHNTQAWKFRILSDTEALMLVDETRILPQTDPTLRQIHIGCGCFTGLFSIGARHEGFRAEVIWFPEGPVSREETGKKPVARLSLHPAEPEDDPLFPFIFSRRTNRLPYEGSTLPDETFSRISGLAAPAFTTLRLLNREETDAARPVLIRGNDTECRTRRTYEESRVWFRADDTAIQTHRDGISLRGNGLSGFKLWLAGFFMDGGSAEAWHSESNLSYYLDRFSDLIASTGSLIALVSPQNEPENWLNSGRDYVRFQLAVTAAGYVLQPLSQVLQEFQEMEADRLEMNRILGILNPQKIQMLVRVGKADPAFLTWRRPVEGLMI